MNIKFELPKPLPFLNTKAVRGDWHCFFLDQVSAKVSWRLMDDSDEVIHSGNWDVPEETFNKWGTDNNTITTAVLLAEPWNV